MSLLKWDITKKRYIDKAWLKLNKGGNKEYKIKTIWNGVVYASELEGYLPGLYYIVL